jgi:branched-subunit amino acid ABC-type transport system permease component
MTDLVGYVIRGIPFGCVFALVAIGLVLTYKTSGVFNLAFAAQAFASAAVYYELRVNHDWPNVPAFLVAVVVVAPLLGLVLERLIFRHLRTAPAVAKLVAALGLLVALPEIVKLWIGSDAAYGVPTIWPNQFAVYHFSDYAIDGNETATVIATVISVVALTLLFRHSTVGLQMRAVVESPRMTELAGINADRVSAASWMLSSLFAGLAGVLIAPLFAQLAATNFTILLVAAIAAAVFARLTSIPMALLGGLLLGILQGILAGYLPLNSILANGLRPSLPFVLLFLLLLFWPGLRGRSELTDPLAGVDPPPPGLAAAARSRGLTIATRVLGAAVVVAGLLVAMLSLDAFWLLIVTEAVILGVVFLSITVITGMAGQISLCQATFAAVGGFATAQLVNEAGLPVLVTVLMGAVMAAAVGALLAIPALRLGGIYLALATFAFALMFDSILVPLGWVSGGPVPLAVPRPELFRGDRAFFLLSVAALAVAGTLVVLVRRGTTGKFLDALRGSETGAAAIGINGSYQRVLAFALSAGLAGLGGGLLVMLDQQANYAANFAPFYGLVWLVLVVTVSARTVEGAIVAGLAFTLLPELLKELGISLEWQYVLFGLGALTYARHPEGILEAQKRRLIAAIQRRTDRRREPVTQAVRADAA